MNFHIVLEHSFGLNEKKFQFIIQLSFQFYFSQSGLFHLLRTEYSKSILKCIAI